VPATAKTIAPTLPPESSDFEQIYRQYFRFVWRVARWLGAPDECLEDVVQDVFIVAHRHLSARLPEASLQTWLYAVARKVVSTLRRTQLRHHRRCDALSTTHHNAAEVDPIARTEAADEILRLLELLDEKRRAVFIACELAGMTAQETATSLGISVSAVYSRIYSARKTLKEAL